MKSRSTDTKTVPRGRIVATLCAETTGPDGTVTLEQPLHSFVRNFAECMRSSYSGRVITDGATDTGGTLRNVLCRAESGGTDATYKGPGGMCLLAPAGADAYGIVVGSSDAAFSVTGHVLGAKISHGNENGQLWYDGTLVGDVVAIFEPDKGIVRIKRLFSNASAEDVTIKEVGLVFHNMVGGVAVDIMISRDVLDTAIIVPAEESILITYKIEGGL